MSDEFDPYHAWLGIGPEEQPANHYRLLGIALWEDDAAAIAHAADQQMAHVRSFQTGKHAAQSQQLLNELSAARLCLLDDYRKAVYDQALRNVHPAVKGVSSVTPTGSPPIWRPRGLGPAAPPATSEPQPPPVVAPAIQPPQFIAPPPLAQSPPLPAVGPVWAEVNPLPQPSVGLEIRRRSSSRSRRRNSRRPLAMRVTTIVLLIVLVLAALVVAYQLWRRQHLPPSENEQPPKSATTLFEVASFFHPCFPREAFPSLARIASEGHRVVATLARAWGGSQNTASIDHRLATAATRK